MTDVVYCAYFDVYFCRTYKNTADVYCAYFPVYFRRTYKMNDDAYFAYRRRA